jgi:hypothetical protein
MTGMEITRRLVERTATRRWGWWIAAAAAAAAGVVAVLAVVSRGSAGEAPAATAAVEQHVAGGAFPRVTLTAAAAGRLGVRTAAVQRAGAGTASVIPYDAVLYDADGAAWTYTSPKHLVFQRQDISVARIDGNSAVLSKGPPPGALVVTVGATEIWGVEYGGIEED